MKAFTVKMFLIMVFGFILSCGSSADSLEIAGSYMDEYGGEHMITEDLWDMGSMGKFWVTSYDNDKEYLIAENAETNEYNPGLWSRIDWMKSENNLYTCQITYDKKTSDEAEAVTGAKRDDLKTGCGGFGWSKMIEIKAD